MKGITIGTVMIIFAGVFFPVLQLFNTPRLLVLIATLTVASVGFFIQMYSAFHMRSSFKKEMVRRNLEHEALIEKAKKLSPEQAIELLLGNTR